MTKENGAERAGSQLLALAAFCLVAAGNVVNALAEVEPLPPATIYDNLADDAESLVLLNRLKQVIERKQDVMEQERELTEEQIAIQAMLEMKAREQQGFQQYPPELSEDDPETLPVPSAVVHTHGNPHSGKRTSFYSSQGKRRANPNRENLEREKKYGQPDKAVLAERSIRKDLMDIASDEEEEDLSLCHFKICNMGRKRQM